MQHGGSSYLINYLYCNHFPIYFWLYTKIDGQNNPEYLILYALRYFLLIEKIIPIMEGSSNNIWVLVQSNRRILKWNIGDNFALIVPPIPIKYCKKVVSIIWKLTMLQTLHQNFQRSFYYTYVKIYNLSFHQIFGKTSQMNIDKNSFNTVLTWKDILSIHRTTFSLCNIFNVMRHICTVSFKYKQMNFLWWHVSFGQKGLPFYQATL